MSIKNFVKKHMVAAGVGAVLLGAGITAIGMQVANRTNHTVLNRSEVKISEEEARKIVEDRTGITDLTYQKFQLEHDDDHINPHYDIDTYKDGVEYDFEIDALTGDILAYSADGNKENVMTSTNTSTDKDKTTASSSTQASSQTISEDKVKEITAKETGKNDLTYVYIHLETDDGRQIYDVKATSGNTEYDLDIDANSGQVISSDQDAISTNKATSGTTSSAKLSEDQVKDIVAKTTGQNNLTYTQIKLSQEQDDYAGALVYEVTAYAAGVEYELDIDANSGQVLSSSADREDD